MGVEDFKNKSSLLFYYGIFAKALCVCGAQHNVCDFAACVCEMHFEFIKF